MDLNLFDIKDRVAVMTGACGVLGTTIVKYFASQGVKMVLLDLERASELGEKIVSEIKADGGEACFLATDVSMRQEAIWRPLLFRRTRVSSTLMWRQSRKSRN